MQWSDLLITGTLLVIALTNPALLLVITGILFYIVWRYD